MPEISDHDYMVFERIVHVLENNAEVSDDEFDKLCQLSHGLEKRLETEALGLLLKKLIPAFRHLRDFRAIMLVKEHGKNEMYQRCINKDDLHFPDFDPIVSAWNRHEIDKLKAEKEGEEWKRSSSTYPRKGDGMPQAPMGFPGASGVTMNGGMRPGGFMPGFSPVDKFMRKPPSKARRRK
jgi:hypothetical protein